MGFNIIDSTATNIKVKGIAGTDITAGDLVSNSETGYITKSSTSIGILNENNNTAGLSSIRGVSSIESTTGYGIESQPFSARQVCEIGNGNIALIYAGDGTTVSTKLNLRIRTTLGADVIAKIEVTTDVNYSTRIIKLNSSKFAIVWDTSSANLKFAIFNNDGTQVGTTVTVASLSSAYAPYWNIGALSNGNLVLCYSEVTTLNFKFVIYDTVGSLVGSAVTVEAGANFAGCTVLGCTNGDFVLNWYRGAATATFKVARYTSSGVLVGSTYTNTSYLLPSYGDFSDSLVELTNGNVVSTCSTASGQYPVAIIFTSSHTVVKAQQISTSTATMIGSELPGLTSLPGGGFAVIGRTTAGNITLMSFDSSGNGILSKTMIPSNPAGSNNSIYASGINLFSLGSIGYAIFMVTYDSGSGYYQVSIKTISSTGSIINEIILQANTITSVYGRSAILTSGGLLVGMYKSAITNLVNDFYYNTHRRSVLGVAAETVSKNQSLSVLTKGTFTINQNYEMGGSFDTTTSTVPGTKGSVIGTTAILRGTL